MRAAIQLHSASTEQPPDFVDAHRRHWEDGNLLYDHDRWANAAYILGLSAECGLKAVMQTLGWMSLDASGKPEPEYRKHIRELWPIYSGLVRDRAGGRYEPTSEDPFDDWSHHNRYADRHHVCQEVVGRYREATKDVTRIMGLAIMDGKL